MFGSAGLTEGYDAVRDLAGHGKWPATIEKEHVMKALVNRAKTFLKSEDGPTATEYAVMLALIVVVCIGAITALGTKVSTAFSGVETAI